jgi:hypothetical protein
MASKAPMKRSPKKKIVDIERLDEFAAAANGESEKERDGKTKIGKPEKAKSLPWKQEGVSELIPKPFNLRTNQVQIEKLKYIIQNTPGFKSVHAFCMDAVEKRINEELEKLLG